MFTKRPVRNGVATRPDEDQEEFVEIFTERQPEDETADRDRGHGRTGYMAELEAWLDAEVFGPIETAIADGDAKELHLAFNEGKQRIKRKVLASYHNGLKAKSNA